MFLVYVVIFFVLFGVLPVLGAWWVIDGEETQWIRKSRNRPAYERIALGYERQAEEYMEYGFMWRAEECLRHAARIRKEGLQKMMDGDIDGI